MQKSSLATATCVQQDVKMDEQSRGEVRTTGLPPQLGLPSDAVHTGWEWRGAMLVKKWATAQRSTTPGAPGASPVEGPAAGAAGASRSQPLIPQAVPASEQKTGSRAATPAGEDGSREGSRERSGSGARKSLGPQVPSSAPAPASTAEPAPDASGHSSGSQARALPLPASAHEVSTARLGRPPAIPSNLPREEAKQKLRPYAARQVPFDVALEVDSVMQAPAAWHQVGRRGGV
jgi:hypothetical protein